MAVEFHCPVCSGTLRVGDGPVGRLVRCGGCLTALKVPDAPPLDVQDDATTDALHTRIELLPVAHPVASLPPTPQAQPAKRARPTEETEEAAPKRSKVFWLSVSLLTLALGMCGCCGLGGMILAPANWETHEWDKERGGFRVDLPAEPQPDMASRVKSVKADRVHDGVEGTFLWTRSETFIVAYRDLKKLPDSDSSFLDDEVAVITSDKDAIDQRSIRSAQITVQDFPGREFEYQFKNGGIVTGRVILAGRRVYVLVAGGPFSRSGNDNARRFLDTFEITDPKLLLLGKLRAGAKKKQPDDPKKKKPLDDPRED